MTLEALQTFGHSLFEEQIALIAQLVSLPSPSGQEGHKARFVRDWLQQHCGIAADIDEVDNVVFRLPGAAGNESILLLAHIDTVFPLGTDLTLTRTEKKLCAPSVGDNSCSVVALLLCLRQLISDGFLPQQPLLFAFNVGEEGLGNLLGVRTLMARYREEIRGVIAVDSTLDHLVTRAVGSKRYRIDVTTCGGHSYGAFGNPSAIAHAANIVARLYAMEVPVTPKTTFNVGTIEGGTSVNTIAQHCSLLLDLRSEDSQCLRALDEQACALIAQEQGERANVSLTMLGERPCGQPIEDETLLTLISAVRDAHGLPQALASGSTDCNIPLSLGVPAVCLGVYRGSGAHTLEESLLLDSLPEGLSFLLDVLQRL